MTLALLALLALAALVVAFLAYRLVRLPAALARSRAPLRLVEPLPEQTGHMVFAGPLEHNEHGFITTPLVPCISLECPCRTNLMRSASISTRTKLN